MRSPLPKLEDKILPGRAVIRGAERHRLLFWRPSGGAIVDTLISSRIRLSFFTRVVYARHCIKRERQGPSDAYLFCSCVSGVTVPSLSAYCVSPYFPADSNDLLGFNDVENRPVLKVAKLVRRNDGRVTNA